MIRRALFASTLASAALFTTSASAITREEVLVRARAYAAHRWSSTAANQKASCSAGYESLFPPGDYVGLPYDWGGYMTLRTFDEQIAGGYGAGSQESDGILACTAGVDCSGFVSMAWSAGHHTTSNLADISGAIAKTELLPGDVFNMAGFHVAMFTHLLQSGAPALVEAAGYNVHKNTFGGWSYVSGYVPRRYVGITGTTAGDPLGTTSRPIPIDAFPFADARNTKISPSSVLDACGAAPATPERGPEYVYVTNITTPGTLSIAVQDDAATDVDVELLTNLATSGCAARDDSSITAEVGCGTYWIVVDTYGTNASKAGPYALTVDLAPSGQPCSAVAGPPAFVPKGKLGDACAYPGEPTLPFCNPNLDAETCVYGASSSFCSKACAADAECAGLGAGACCRDLGKGELYCMTAPYCGAGGVADAGLGTSDGGKGSATEDDPSAGGDDGDDGAGASGDDAPAASDGAATDAPDGGAGGCAQAPSARGPDASFALALASLLLLRRRRR